MFNKLKHVMAVWAGKNLLSSGKTSELSKGKRIFSILAGAYIIKIGFENVTKRPVIAVQELALGALLVYNGTTGINKVYTKPKRNFSEVRLNQIQGNDPTSAVPEFV